MANNPQDELSKKILAQGLAPIHADGLECVFRIAGDLKTGTFSEPNAELIFMDNRLAMPVARIIIPKVIVETTIRVLNEGLKQLNEKKSSL